MTRVLVLLCCLVVAGCTETVPLGGGQLSGLISLELSPPAATATVTDLTAGPVAVKFTAIGRFIDGTRRDITHLVAWTVDNAAPGAITDGVYLTSNAAGGHAVVRARALVGASAVEADADIHVIVALELVDGVFPPPVGAEVLFTPGAKIDVGGPRAPSLLYPSRDTMFPQDLARIVFQHQPAPGTDAFRWRLVSESLYLSVLTGGTRWQPDGAVWNVIAATHMGAEAALVIEAADSTQPGTIYAAAEARLRFARGGAGGIIYHWSNGNSAINRSTLSAESPTRLYPELPDTKCVGCHAISRDGKQMAFGYDGEFLRSVELAEMTPILTTPARPMGWTTFSPDGSMIVTADKGTLTLRDAASGNPIGPNSGRLPIASRATHPDWAPDGAYLAMTLTTDMITTNQNVTSGAIARIPFNGPGAWGSVEILVPGGATNNNYFPKYSPDNRYLAFVHASGPSEGAPLAELRMIRAEGGPQIALTTASHRVHSQDGVPDLANTMPSWSPDIDDNLGWLAFASARPYGEILPARGTTQVWITAVNFGLAELGVDPSFAAFWLPSQDVRVVNNNPIWASPVAPPN
jgi:WD40-like Beta Propeller Repeat